MTKQPAKNMRRFLCTFMVVVVFFCAPFSSFGASEDKKLLEVQLQAVYLYNFFNFVKWPSQDSPDKKDSLKIGVIGESAINRELDILKEKVADSKKIALDIVHYGPYDSKKDYRDCQIIFVSRSEKANFKKITDSLGNSPILTVADSEDFIDAGGIISLINIDNRLRFQINRSAAFLAGLNLSSQLLKTAVLVR